METGYRMLHIACIRVVGTTCSVMDNLDFVGLALLDSLNYRFMKAGV